VAPPPGERFAHLSPVVDRLRDEALEREAWVAAHGDGPRFDEMVLAGVGLGPPPDVRPPQVGDIIYPPLQDDAERRADVNRLAGERWT
jgi:hypothetical protein